MMNATFRRTASTLMAASLLLATAGCSVDSGPGQQSPSPSASSPGAPSGAGQSGSAKAGSGGAPDSGQYLKGTGGLPAVPEIVREVESAVVTIRTRQGLGSGVVYRSDGTIVTDAHVVENSNNVPYDTVNVQFADGKRVPAKVVGTDDITDVAVIKADRDGLAVPEFNTERPEVGQMAVVIGSPMGLVQTVTAGIVSGLNRNMPPSEEMPQGLFNLLQTDAPISPGASGGAVVNGAAEVIGLAEAYLPPSTGAVAIGFVTPASTVTDVANQLLKNGDVKHAFMGVRLSGITPQIAQRFDLATTSGALVIDVVKGGPAADAGMKSGDIITVFDGTKITRVEDLLAQLRSHEPGQQVPVTVQRDDQTKTLELTLGDLPASAG